MAWKAETGYIKFLEKQNVTKENTEGRKQGALDRKGCCRETHNLHFVHGYATTNQTKWVFW